MPLYCLGLKQRSEDMFLVDAPTVERAVEILQSEILFGGTPDPKRFAGGNMQHTVADFRVVRKDDPADHASWNTRTGGVVSAHGYSRTFSANEIALLLRDLVIVKCEQCAPGERTIYHPAQVTFTIEAVQAALDRRSHRGIGTNPS